jgi:hypothetical protein
MAGLLLSTRTSFGTASIRRAARGALAWGCAVAAAAAGAAFGQGADHPHLTAALQLALGAVRLAGYAAALGQATLTLHSSHSSRAETSTPPSVVPAASWAHSGPRPGSFAGSFGGGSFTASGSGRMPRELSGPLLGGCGPGSSSSSGSGSPAPPSSSSSSSSSSFASLRARGLHLRLRLRGLRPRGLFSDAARDRPGSSAGLLAAPWLLLASADLLRAALPLSSSSAAAAAAAAALLLQPPAPAPAPPQWGGGQWGGGQWGGGQWGGGLLQRDLFLCGGRSTGGRSPACGGGEGGGGGGGGGAGALAFAAALSLLEHVVVPLLAAAALVRAR